MQENRRDLDEVEKRVLTEVFSKYSEPDHVSRSLFGGLIALAVTGSGPIFLGSLIAFFIASSIYEGHKNKQLNENTPHV